MRDEGGELRYEGGGLKAHVLRRGGGGWKCARFRSESGSGFMKNIMNPDPAK